MDIDKNAAVPFEVTLSGSVAPEHVSEFLAALSQAVKAIGSVSLSHDVELNLGAGQDETTGTEDTSQYPRESQPTSFVSKKRMPPDQLYASLRQMGSLIREERIALGQTLKTLGESAGVTDVYIHMIETGMNPKTRKPSRPSPDILFKIAESLDLDPNELLKMAGYVVVSAETQ